MTEASIIAIKMPKWGLSMSEGKVGDWLVEVGKEINIGDEILEVETDKIASSVEATDGGVLRRQLGQFDEVLPVGGLLGVMADSSVSDGDIDAFIEEFQANFVPEESGEDGDAGNAYAKINIGGRDIRYVQQGDGEQNVVLIHGFGGDIDNWLFNLGDLSAKATVYALDLPGHGQSSKEVGDGSLETLAQCVVDFMDELDITKAHLVGHSMGGAIAQQIAIDHPDRVASLGLICSAGLGDEINQDYIDGFTHANSRREVKPHLQKLFADESLVTRQIIDDILKYKRLDGVEQALQTIGTAHFAGGKQQSVSADQTATLNIPVLAISGEADQIIPAAHTENAPQSIETKVIDGAGHMVQMEAAGEVNKMLIELIQRGSG